MISSDQLNREITIAGPLHRIVSLVPSQTELLMGMGLEANLVGVTKFCVHPEGLQTTKTVVGGTKKVNFNKIKELHPDIILCNKEENTLAMVQELEGIAPVHVSDVVDIKDALELIEMYGELFNKIDRARSLVKDINLKVTSFTKLRKKKLRVAYLIWRDPWMAAGGNTFIDSMLALNGWENVFTVGQERYPIIGLKAIKEAAPDLIMLSSEPFPFKEIHKKEIEKYCNSKIAFVNGEYFSWYGSRMLLAVDYFAQFQKHLSNSL